MADRSIHHNVLKILKMFNKLNLWNYSYCRRIVMMWLSHKKGVEKHLEVLELW